MKMRYVIGSFVMTMMVLQVLGQENDDMYFNSKDREKKKVEAASTASVNKKIDDDYKAFKKKHFDQEEEAEASTETANPTDSYSARNVNPEYISRSNAEQASEDEQNYYVEGYTPNTYDSYSSGNYPNYSSNNNYYNNPNYNNWNYGNSFYNPYNSWYAPSYGCNPYMNPYYGGSGWNLALSYGWGSMSPWNYGMSYGWGSPYYGGYYSPYSGYGYPYYYYGGSEVSRANYGKRPSRHSAVVTPTTRSNQRLAATTNSSVNTNGRSRTRPTSDEYYVKPMRRTSTFENTTDGTRSNSYSVPGSSTDRNRSRSYDSNSRQTQTRPSYSAPSRSNSSGGSAPSRPSSRSRGN